MEGYELDRVRDMMIDMLRQPEDFKQWFGRFVSTPRHELDIAPPEPSYAPQEVREALLNGESLTRLSGLRVLNVDGSFFINGEACAPADARATDLLSRYTEVDATLLGEALDNPAFVAALAELVNQGYWYFNE